MASKRIQKLERMRSSVNGNPRFLVIFDDGTSGKTQPDASLAYGIENPEYFAGPVEVTFDGYGNIDNMVPQKSFACAAHPCLKAPKTEIPAGKESFVRIPGSNNREARHMECRNQPGFWETSA